MKNLECEVEEIVQHRATEAILQRKFIIMEVFFSNFSSGVYGVF